jgi:hypothetical protein
MERRVKFSEEGARRIIAATRAYERGNRDQSPVKFRTVGDDGTPIKIGKTVAQWAKGTTQEVELIYETSCEDEGGGSGGETLEAHNKSHDVAADTIVILGLAGNGCWYLIEAASCPDEGSDSGSGDCGCVSIGGQDLTTLEGYDETKSQLLGHEEGCLKWFDTTECDTGSGS